MIPIVDGLLDVIGGFLTLHNLKEARKYLDEVYQTTKEINEEEAKGVDAIDDGKLEALYKQRENARQAMNAAIAQGMPK